MPKGEWNAETDYAMLDFVTHEGTAWIGKKILSHLMNNE